MFHTPENNAAARSKLSLSISDSDALNVLTPRNPLVDKNSVANVLKNSQGLFSPVYSKRLDYFILEDKIRAHSNKHIINLKDNIALLNTDKQKLENYLISKGFNLEQDATLFLCENDAVNVIYEIINSDIGVLAREKLQKENSARVVIKILTSHLSHKLDGIQYYHRSPESTVMTLCPLEAVTLILENDKENPQSFFCQTVFPMSAKKQQELVEDSTKKLYERMFVKNKMPFRRIFKEYFNRALMGLEDWNVVENYCEHYHNYFAELQVLSTTPPEKNYQRDLSIHFTKCCEIDQSLLDGVIERYLKRYKISYSYRAQLWVVNYNGNVKEYNYYGEGTHLQYHSCYISKVLPFRHFPTVGSPSAVAVKGCKDTQVKKTLERHWVSENPAQKLQSVLKEYYLNTPAAKTREKEQNLHSLRDLLREDGYGMYVLCQFFDEYGRSKSRELKRTLDAIKHYIHGSQRLSIESLRDIAKVKDNLEIHLREIETLLKNHDNYASAIATQYAAKPVFTQFMALHSASVIKLFIMLDEDPQSNKIDKKTLASMFPGDNKDAVADLYEWALQLRKSSLNNAKNTEPASIIPFPELVKKMKHTPKEGIEYVKKALISRRKSRLERTINNTGFNYEMFVNFKRTTLHYALQILSSLHKNLKDLIKIDLFLLKESSIRVSSSVDIEGFNSPERIRTLITVLKNKLLNMDLEDGDVKRVCRLVKDYFNQVECLSLRMKKLFTLWRDRDTFSSRLNELFQSEMNVFNEKRAKNLLALVKKNVDNLLSVIQAVKPLFSDPGADSIMNAKVEIANFSKKVKELIRDVQNFEMSAKKAFNSLIIAFEELLGNNDVKNLRMHVTSLEKFVLSNNNKNNRGIDSEKLSIALDVFWETFSTLKDEQTLLASNWALDPVDIFYNKFEIYAAQVRALKINRAEFGSGNFDSEILEMIQIQLGFFVSGSMEMLAMFEQGINIYEQAKILDKNTEEQAFQQDVLEGAPITKPYVIN